MADRSQLSAAKASTTLRAKAFRESPELDLHTMKTAMPPASANPRNNRITTFILLVLE